MTRDGYLVADALIARTGIQDYLGTEVGKPEMPRVRVFRPAEEVFATDALASVAHRPITIDHPAENVTAENWKRLGVGDIGDEIVRDGERIRVPIKIMDAAAIKSVRSTHTQFSAGYSCTLDWTPGEFEGQAYDAVQREIRWNHLAAVKSARGGPELRIIDERPQGDRSVATKIITFDGLPVEVTDAAEAVINKLLGQMATSTKALDAANASVATLTTDAAAKDAEIVTLKQAVVDAKVTPAQMRDAAKAYAVTVERAKKLAPAAVITDAMDEAAIKSTVVTAKLGDAAKGWTDAQIDVSFATMAAGLGDSGTKVDALRGVITDGVTTINDAAAARDAAKAARSARYATSYLGTAAA